MDSSAPTFMSSGFYFDFYHTFLPLPMFALITDTPICTDELLKAHCGTPVSDPLVDWLTLEEVSIFNQSLVARLGESYDSKHVHPRLSLAETELRRQCKNISSEILNLLEMLIWFNIHCLNVKMAK